MNSHTPLIQQSASAPESSPLVQVSGALAGIILLILVVGWLVKRSGFAPKSSSTQKLKVSASCQVGTRERVVVVEVEDVRLVLGVTAQQITHLHTLPAGEKNETPPAAPADFRQLMQNLVKRNGKN